MKNVFVLPTDKPSRLWTNNLRRRLELDEFPSQHLSIAIHIYITSDEEIKEGDWGINLAHNMIVKPTDAEWANSNSNNLKKIILTTDQDLIGVQAIDDEFLEWFVKNPSCEEVEVNKLCYGALSGFADAGYKIIIPKEEPKQERMYSEEEAGELVYSIIGQYANQVNIMIDGDIVDRLFEQFKKKT